MQRHDVRMVKPRGHADLLQESLWTKRGGDLRVQHLERDGPIVSQIVRGVYDGHPAAANLALESVASGEGLLQGWLCRSHEVRLG